MGVYKIWPRKWGLIELNSGSGSDTKEAQHETPNFWPCSGGVSQKRNIATTGRSYGCDPADQLQGSPE